MRVEPCLTLLSPCAVLLSRPLVPVRRPRYILLHTRPRKSDADVISATKPGGAEIRCGVFRKKLVHNDRRPAVIGKLSTALLSYTPNACDVIFRASNLFRLRSPEDRAVYSFSVGRGPCTTSLRSLSRVAVAARHVLLCCTSIMCISYIYFLSNCVRFGVPVQRSRPQTSCQNRPIYQMCSSTIVRQS